MCSFLAAGWASCRGVIIEGNTVKQIVNVGVILELMLLVMWEKLEHLEDIAPSQGVADTILRVDCDCTI